MATTQSARRRTAALAVSIFAVYFVWGSTYLALRFGLEGFPPFLLNAFRFLFAGGVMYLVVRVRGAPPPTRRQWVNLAGVGALLLVGGVGLVTIAEDLGVGSGVAATAVAVMPLWAALTGGLFGTWPVPKEWAGLVLGFAGVAVLAQEGDFEATLAGTVLVVLAPMLWAFGSVWAGRLDMPPTVTATAGQLLAGGVILLVAGPLRGERLGPWPPAVAWLALGYLAVFGSILAYTAYVYLLREVRPAVATSYAYVNPVVAVALGLTVGDERVTGPLFAALPLILAGVALVTIPARRRPG
jgi:drug/metabolite transporter (DMT)-like permease